MGVGRRIDRNPGHRTAEDSQLGDGPQGIRGPNVLLDPLEQCRFRSSCGRIPPSEFIGDRFVCRTYHYSE